MAAKGQARPGLERAPSFGEVRGDAPSFVAEEWGGSGRAGEPGATGLHKSWNGFRSDGFSAGFDTDVAAPPRPAVVWRSHQDAAAAGAGRKREGVPCAGGPRRRRGA